MLRRAGCQRPDARLLLFRGGDDRNVFRFSGGIFGRLVQAAPVAFSSTLLTKLG